MGDRLALSVAEAAQEIGCSPKLIRDLITRNEIPHVRLGRRVVLPRELLREWLERRASANGEVTLLAKRTSAR